MAIFSEVVDELAETVRKYVDSFSFETYPRFVTCILGSTLDAESMGDLPTPSGVPYVMLMIDPNATETERASLPVRIGNFPVKVVYGTAHPISAYIRATMWHV